MNFQSKENRELNMFKEVRMYRNLNNGKLSVQQKLKSGWRVVGWVDFLQLEKVRTHFDRTKQQKAVSDKVRNVHAYIVGFPVTEKADGQTNELTYNPFIYNEFVNKETKENVYKVETLFISKDGKMIYK